MGMPSAFAEDQSPNEVIESAVSILTERMDGQKEALSADRRGNVRADRRSAVAAI